ncbi:hypothetical protein SAMN05192570_0315 [Brevundimonas viscosa]|uniref:Uncharacterized protein n=1 Tax=Brevundimonas viscosa TaxID=871741 RepID=A0A1I6NPZ3_9CAUL|nr:hypothetical protein SAMN05192570_0315 [Brevundimonas viscosa]
MHGEARRLRYVDQNARTPKRGCAHRIFDQPGQMLQRRRSCSQGCKFERIGIVSFAGGRYELHEITVGVPKSRPRRLARKLWEPLERLVRALEDGLKLLGRIGRERKAGCSDIDVAGHERRRRQTAPHQGFAEKVGRGSDEHGPSAEQPGMCECIQHCSHCSIGSGNSLASERRHQAPSFRCKRRPELKSLRMRLGFLVASLADKLIYTGAADPDFRIDVFAGLCRPTIDGSSRGSGLELLLQLCDEGAQRRADGSPHTDTYAEPVCIKRAVRDRRYACERAVCKATRGSRLRRRRSPGTTPRSGGRRRRWASSGRNRAPDESRSRRLRCGSSRPPGSAGR